MPETKATDRISISNDGVVNLRQHLGGATKDAAADPSMYFMVMPEEVNTTNSSTALRTDSPLNLVMNAKQSKATLRGQKRSHVASTAKTSRSLPKFTTDISSPNSMTVPTYPANKLNYFPKPLSNFQGVPVPGNFLQRIGPFHYNPVSTGAPLVAFVNPTATSVIPQSLNPVFTAQSSIPSVETMNQIVYNSMSPTTANMSPHPQTPVILVQSSAPLSKSGNNFQYVMPLTEKSGTSFQKSAPQTIFGNENSGKFIPVATIVPNNASLTDSQKTVTSVLSGEPVLSTYNNLKYPEPCERKRVLNSGSPKSKHPKLNRPNTSWHQKMNRHSLAFEPQSSGNTKLESSSVPVSHPLNLTLQSLPYSTTSGASHKNGPFSDKMCNQQQYIPGQPFLSSRMAFQSPPTTSSPSPLIFDSAAYSLPNQNVHLHSPPPSHHRDLHRISSHPAFGNHTAAYNSKTKSGSPQRYLLNSNFNNYSPSPITQIPDQNAHAISNDEFPMTLKIDSIFSLAGDHPLTQPLSIKQKTPKKLKLKTPTPPKLVHKEKKFVPRLSAILPKPRGRPPQKEKKLPMKRGPKPKYKGVNRPLENMDTLKNIEAILARHASAQKSELAVSHHANALQSVLNPISVEEKCTLPKVEKIPMKCTLTKYGKIPMKRGPKPKYKGMIRPLKNIDAILARKAFAQKSDITVSCHANVFQSLLNPISEEERKLNAFFKYLGLCPSSSVTPNSNTSSNDVPAKAGAPANGRCNVSKELAHCFNCYVVVPMFKVPEEGFETVDLNDPPASLTLLDKCSKECRHTFLNKQHTTTGIVPRDVDFDSCWKIVRQSPQKCSPHARKKYCRKSKTKASGNLTGSHCRRAGCIGCSTKRPTTTHNKIKYFRKATSKDDTVSGSIVAKVQRRRGPPPGSRKRIYTFKKKSSLNTIKRIVNSKEENLVTDSTFINVLGEKNSSVSKKRKTNQSKSAKLPKTDFSELENVISNGDIIQPESVDEVSPFSSSFLDLEDSCHIEESPLVLEEKKVIRIEEPITSPQADISASSERIQRLKEILKEKQKDLEIARQLLL